MECRMKIDKFGSRNWCLYKSSMCKLFNTQHSHFTSRCSLHKEFIFSVLFVCSTSSEYLSIFKVIITYEKSTVPRLFSNCLGIRLNSKWEPFSYLPYNDVGNVDSNIDRVTVSYSFFVFYPWCITFCLLIFMQNIAPFSDTLIQSWNPFERLGGISGTVYTIYVCIKWVIWWSINVCGWTHFTFMVHPTWFEEYSSSVWRIDILPRICMCSGNLWPLDIFLQRKHFFFFGTTILYVIWNLDIECNNIEMRQQIFD